MNVTGPTLFKCPPPGGIIQGILGHAFCLARELPHDMALLMDELSRVGRAAERSRQVQPAT